MARRPTVAAIAALALAAGMHADESENLFRSEVAGIQLAKPDGWSFQNLETVARHRASAKLKDSELQKAIVQMASAPVVVATMHPEPYESLNPSFQLLVRPLGQLQEITGEEVLEKVIPTLENLFAEFRLVEEISAVAIDGVPGARMTAEYVVETQEGVVYPTRATIVVVPRGSYLFQFGFSAPPEGPDAITDEVETTLASVDFLDDEG